MYIGQNDCLSNMKLTIAVRLHFKEFRLLLMNLLITTSVSIIGCLAFFRTNNICL